MRIGTFLGGDSTAEPQVQYVVDAESDGLGNVWATEAFACISLRA